jgi:hypothetical protein
MDFHRTFMQSPSLTQARQRIEACTAELRKQKRTELQLKRRLQTSHTDFAFASNLEVLEPRLLTPQTPEVLLELLLGVLKNYPQEAQVTLASIQRVTATFSDDFARQHDNELQPLYTLSARLLEEYLDSDRHPPAVVKEALLALSELAPISSDFISAFEATAAVSRLIQLVPICEQTLLEPLMVSIGNLSSDKTIAAEFRRGGVLKAFDSILKTVDRTQAWQKQCAWTTSKIIQGSIRQPDAVYYESLQIFSKLKELEDPQADTDILWGCCALTSGDEATIEEFMRSELFPFAFNKLRLWSIKANSVAVLGVFSNLLSGDTSVTRQLLAFGAADLIAQYLTLEDDYLVKEALLGLSNIAIDSPASAMKLLTSAIVPHAVRSVGSRHPPLASEACYFLYAMAKTLPTCLTERLHSEFNAFDISSRGLSHLEPAALHNLLMALQALLRVACQSSQLEAVVSSLEVSGWMPALEFLHDSANEQVSSVASDILKDFFDCDTQTFHFS